MIACLVLLAGAPFLLGDGPPQEARDWLLQEPMRADQSLQVELVRAHVKVTRRAGPLVVKIAARGASDLRGVSFRVVRDGQTIRIIDVYPGSSDAGFRKECEPPIGERGPYWRSMMPLTVEISLPPGVRTDVRLLEELRD